MMKKANKREINERTMKKGAEVDRDRSKHMRQKYQQVVETFKKMGNKTDVSEEDEEMVEGEAELEIPEVIGISLNLSKKNLKAFPEEVLEKLGKVQYLYLERNKLTELPEEFFQHTPSLKWLDLRNNNLIGLPTTGLKDHPSLEVILLQGNRIRNLPVELATIPSLKGLQTTGNPITNVPYDIIEEGFEGIQKHLKKLLFQEEALLSVSDTRIDKPSTSQDESHMAFASKVIDPSDSELRMWDLDKLAQWRLFMKRKSHNRKAFDVKSHVKKFEPQHALHQPNISVSLRSQPKPPPAKPQPFRCGIYNRNRHRTISSALRNLRMRKTRYGYKRKPITLAMIHEKARKEIYRQQVRETLEKQARKIQRMRDKEVLKTWQDHAKITREQMKLLDNYQPYPSKDFASKTPFDVDPEFLNMLNRVDLYRSLKEYDNRSKRIKKPKVRITALDLEMQMNEIMKKLKELDTNDAEENVSPRMKCSHVCNKMIKIMDIQKTLKNLQTLNSSMSGIVPFIKTKPKN